MANLFDYLDWRGDLTLAQDPLNQVDNLILSRISYLPLDGIVPEPGDGFRSIGDTAKQFFDEQQNNAPGDQRRVLMKNDARLLSALAESPRFRTMQLSRYVNHIDFQEEKQFSAVSISLGTGAHYLSYRGTDDTFIGWKEDFNMGYLETIPSQKEAVAYLETAAAALPGPLFLGGHSKGGNLAVYAAAFCRPETQKRIPAVYNNDGPGFNAQVLETPGYQAVQERIHTFVPQSSVVGMLLDHEENYTVVHSKQVGLLQHDIYSWQLMGKELEQLDTVTDGSRFLDKTLQHWVASMDPAQREQFVDALYDVLSATNATTVTGLAKNMGALGQALKDADTPDKQAIIGALRLLFRSARENLPVLWEKEDEKDT